MVEELAPEADPEPKRRRKGQADVEDCETPNEVRFKTISPPTTLEGKTPLEFAWRQCYTAAVLYGAKIVAAIAGCDPREVLLIKQSVLLFFVSVFSRRRAAFSEDLLKAFPHHEVEDHTWIYMSCSARSAISCEEGAALVDIGTTPPKLPEGDEVQRIIDLLHPFWSELRDIHLHPARQPRDIRLLDLMDAIMDETGDKKPDPPGSKIAEALAPIKPRIYYEDRNL